MALINILKRKDASSVVVAVALGFVLWTVANALAGMLTLLVTGDGKGLEFIDFVRPLVAVVFQLVLIEVGVRAAIGAREGIKSSK